MRLAGSGWCWPCFMVPAGSRVRGDGRRGQAGEGHGEREGPHLQGHRNPARQRGRNVPRQGFAVDQPGCKHFAFAIQKDAKQAPVVDGVVGKEYNGEITGLNSAATETPRVLPVHG